MKKKILVTGGCGFIGSNFIHYMLSKGHEIINLDALTYAGNPDNLRGVDKNYRFVHGRIEDKKVFELMKDVEYVVNFAAETHVDRSILDPEPFINTNIKGTANLLEACRRSDVRKFVHISTDEVYGELGEKGKFNEDLPLLPNSPYSASKACADLMIRAYHRTYGIPVTTARPSNNYGPYQYPEKFIPLAITNLLEDKPIPVYGDGRNIRDWVFVEDCCKGIELILEKGKDGEIYNVGGENEKRNIEIVKMIIRLMNKDESYIRFVKDRPGHDYRYALDNTKIRKIGWAPSVDIEEGLMRTIEWYKNNVTWWKPLKNKLAKESKGFWS